MSTSEILGLELDGAVELAAILADYVAGGGSTLYASDPRRLMLATVADRVAAQKALIELAARRGLLQYSEGTHLEALGDLLGVVKLDAASATCTLRWTLTAAQPAIVTIPAGTRATEGTYLWATSELIEIAPGDTTGDVLAESTTAGTAPNGLIAGQIATIVDPIAHVASVANLDATTGGSDAETGDELRARIRLAPSSLSVAGPRAGYDYWARTASAAISDVSVSSPAPGQVLVTVLLQGGAIPGAGVLSAVTAAVSADEVRPLTDSVTVQAPAEIQYNVTLTWYLAQSDSGQATEIQAAVTAAITAWVAWQRAVLGRDVNPSQLIADIVGAGAKRVVLTAPVFAPITDAQIAVLDVSTVTYGGLEAD